MDDGCLDAEALSWMMDMDHVMDVWIIQKKEGIDGTRTDKENAQHVEVPKNCHVAKNYDASKLGL